jgi:hypothetical protein
MEKTTIELFNWFDIRQAICKEMGIEEKDFRDYQIFGGEYKDLWHEWLNYFQPDVTNDVILNNDSTYWESLQSKISWVKRDKKEWLIPFVKAVYNVFDDNKIKYIKYSW